MQLDLARVAVLRAAKQYVTPVQEQVAQSHALHLTGARPGQRQEQEERFVTHGLPAAGHDVLAPAGASARVDRRLELADVIVVRRVTPALGNGRRLPALVVR